MGVKCFIYPLNHPADPIFSFQPAPHLVHPAPLVFEGYCKHRRPASLGASVLTTVPTVWIGWEPTELSATFLFPPDGDHRESSCWKVGSCLLLPHSGMLSLSWHSSLRLLSQGKERYVVCVTEVRAQQTSSLSSPSNLSESDIDGKVSLFKNLYT